MQKGVLLYCFDTSETKYHAILTRCVQLIKSNLQLPITVVTDKETHKHLGSLDSVDYKFIEPEKGNTKNGKQWHNADRHMSYDLSPYETTLVMDIDYFPFTDNLRRFMDTQYDFLVAKDAYDLSGRNSFDKRRYSMIDMVWATVLVFRKTEKAKKIFEMVKDVKEFYPYFNEIYRIYSKNFRNDYAFAIALEQINGFMEYATLPIQLPTLPPDCKILSISDEGLAWQGDGKIMHTVGQDVHVLNKELADV